MLTAEVALNTGQLVKDEEFTLFDAVGALEVCTFSIRLQSLLPKIPSLTWPGARFTL